MQGCIYVLDENGGIRPDAAMLNACKYMPDEDGLPRRNECLLACAVHLTTFTSRRQVEVVVAVASIGLTCTWLEWANPVKVRYCNINKLSFVPLVGM